MTYPAQTHRHRRAFSTRLRVAMTAKSIRRKDLAIALGVTVDTVQGWMGGGYLPRPASLLALPEVLDCSLDWLLDPSPIDTHTPNAPLVGDANAIEHILLTSKKPAVALSDHLAARLSLYDAQLHTLTMPTHNEDTDA